VLLDAILELLDPDPDSVVLDCTAGGGGHARALAERMGPAGRLVALDRDPDAVARLGQQLAGVPPDVVCVQDDFRNLDRVLADVGIEAVDRVLADLGLSSFQLDDPARGFSFQHPGPLDMRFNRAEAETAGRWINRAGPLELARVIEEYGEERFAHRVARAIVDARPIRDTVTLAEVVRRAVPRGSPRLDRATRTFQAIRIKINDELGALESMLEKGLDALGPRGRFAVISFQGLETKRVRTAFRGAVKLGRVSLLTPTPIRPTRAEVARNPRSRSALLRCVERLG
jgi:16S rRNA (cytosine1402-N4)-methyltransferase